MKNKLRRKNVIVKCAADFLTPFSIVWGMIIILFGTASSGGGFQGGVVVAGAVILLYLGYGYKGVSRAIHGEAIRRHEAVGAVLYVLLALVALFFGANFCRNIFWDNGAVGELISGGTITFMSWAVGYKVLTGVGFLLLLLLGLLAPDDEQGKE